MDISVRRKGKEDTVERKNDLNMENAFLYEYLKHTKDGLKCLEKPENIGKYNVIKSIIQNGCTKDIYTDIEAQKEALTNIEEILESLKAAKQKRTSDKTDEEKNIYELGVRLTRKLSKYEKCIDRMTNYMIHYNAVMKNWACSFVIVFANDEVWSVNYTRSLRKDRIDTHIARFSYLHSDRNLLVIPNYEEQDDLSKALIKKLKNNPTEYGTSVIVVSFEELLDKILENIFSYKSREGQLVKVPTKRALAIVNGVRGVEIERIYSKCLANEANFKAYLEESDKWSKEETNGTFLPSEFCLVLDKILLDKGLEKRSISRIEAIDMGDLQLKPDVYLRIYLSEQEASPIEIGISIKSSSGESVSFHEKKAIDFVDELEIQDEGVKRALDKFQQEQAVSRLTSAEQRSLTDYFTDENNRRRLVTWAVTGGESDQYRAHYILIHRYGNEGDSLGINISPVEAYIDKFMSKGPVKTFNSGFSWTYKAVIQLKGPLFWDEEEA